jgi:uncharacterized repeat protein (TIGR03943 family)
VKPLDRPLLVGGLGALAVWIGSTDAIFRFLRPSMRPWLVAAGLVLVGLAVMAGWETWRSDTDTDTDTGTGTDGHTDTHTGTGTDTDSDGHHRGPSRIGWLLLAPIVVAVLLDPSALGAAAVDRAGPVNRGVATRFDLDEYLGTARLSGATPSLTLRRFVSAADDPANEARLAATPVKLQGFVSGQPGPGEIALSRLVVGCCAADALPVTVEVRGVEGAPLADDTWLEVEGRLDPEATGAARAAGGPGAPPVVQATAVRPIDAPREPYEYPY